MIRKPSLPLALLGILGCWSWAGTVSPLFEAVQLDAEVGIGYGVAVADMNGDRRPDILLADRDRIVWYQNPTWRRHTLAGKLTAHDHVCLAATDLDGDGLGDVAVGAEWNPSDTLNSGAVFHLLPQANRLEPWRAAPLPHEPTVHRMRWVRNRESRFDLVMLPLHGRGNDPRTGLGDGVRMLAYQRPGNPGESWLVSTLDDTLHKTHNFDPVQWDDDPEDELLVAALEGIFLLDRAPSGTQRRRLAGPDGGGAGEVRAGRFGDGKRFVAAVEPMHGTNLVLYLPPAPAEAGGPWERRVLDSTLAEGHALATGDLAGLGRDQIVVGWRSRNPGEGKVGIRLFSPRDDAGRQWESAWVDEDGMACEDLCLADLDADGRLDIVAAGRATHNLKLYRSRSRAP